jgi:hypothetical protein
MTNMADDWRMRDDLDLTSEDVSAMFEAGEAEEVRGPWVPANGHFVTVSCTFGGAAHRTPLLPSLTPPPQVSTSRR